MALSHAGVLFQQVLKGGPQFLEGLIRDQQQETEWLDFKGADKIDDSTVKKTWSEAIAGFANNQGGVLIWGIDARRDPTTDIDAACGLSLVSDPAALRSRLVQLQHQATEPPVSGIEVHHFTLDSKTGAGFVACLVPESNTKPHRADFCSGKPYPMRIGASFVIASTSLLRSLFHPRVQPILWVEVTPEWEDSFQDTSAIDISFAVVVHNAGLVSARDVSLVLTTNTPSPKLLVGPDWRKTNISSALGTAYLPQLIHPNTFVECCRIVQSFPTCHVYSSGPSTVQPRFDHVKITFQFAATDMFSEPIKVEFSDRNVQFRRTVRSGGPNPAPAV